MKVALFLHIYQPPTQFANVTRQIAQDSYAAFTKALEDSSRGKLTLNLTASLTKELVKIGREDLLQRWNKLIKEERLELTGTAAYHPLLTKLPVNQIRRQVELNEQINRQYLSHFRPRGFFPPEMLYDNNLADVLAGLGYEWILLDESAHPLASIKASSKIGRDELALGKRIYQLPGLGVKVFFRQREISLKIAFSEKFSLTKLKKLLGRVLDPGDYVVLAMDGETFGHHHQDNLVFFAELMNSPELEQVTVSELLASYPPAQVRPLRSTWGITVKSKKGGRVFPRWDNPSNPVHQLQWRLFNLAVRVGSASEAQPLLDEAVHSDQFWWAGHNPCWHPEMVRRGAEMLKEVVLTSERSTDLDKEQAKQTYSEINQAGERLFGASIIPC